MCILIHIYVRIRISCRLIVNSCVKDNESKNHALGMAIFISFSLKMKHKAFLGLNWISLCLWQYFEFCANFLKSK